MNVPPFQLTVRANSEGHVSDQARGKILAFLRKYAGVEFDIVIRQHDAQRSLDQNAYLHAEPFPRIAAEMGDSIEATKLVLMGECWGWKRNAFTGRDVPVMPHTSSMTKEQCTFFIDWLIPFAAQKFGLVIRFPDEWQRTAA